MKFILIGRSRRTKRGVAEKSLSCKTENGKCAMPAVQKRTQSLWAIATVLTALSVADAIGCGSSKSAEPKNVHQTFEDSDEGWIPFGPDAQVEVTRERTQIKDGGAALALHYVFH